MISEGKNTIIICGHQDERKERDVRHEAITTVRRESARRKGVKNLPHTPCDLQLFGIGDHEKEIAY
jgi:hypothetical protein